jgi:hypothetical protein
MVLIEYATPPGTSSEIKQFYRAFGRDDFVEMNGPTNDPEPVVEPASLRGYDHDTPPQSFYAQE